MAQQNFILRSSFVEEALCIRRLITLELRISGRFAAMVALEEKRECVPVAAALITKAQPFRLSTSFVEERRATALSIDIVGQEA